MIAGLSIGTELRRFAKGRLPKIALVALVFIPLLYGALYLWAFQNPFGEVDKLPVALVNEDQGAAVDGQQTSAGDRIAGQLLERGDLDWQQVSHERAMDGLHHGDYYFAVQIPQGFSAAVASPMSDDPHQAQIRVTYDDSNSYLGTIIGQNAMNELQLAVSTQISSQSVDKVLVGLQSAGDGLQQAAGGASRLADGAADLDDGAADLDDGAGTLSDGIDTAYSGSGQLADGAATLSGGINTAAGGAARLTDGLGRLDAGADRLGAGAQRISGGIDQLVGMLAPIGRAQSDAAASVAQVADMLRANGDPVSRQAVSALDRLTHTLHSQGLSPGKLDQLHRLRAGAAQLSDELNDPSSQFRGGIDQLTSGGAELQSGLQRLSDGGHRLRDASATLHDGLGELSDGGRTLTSGTAELTDGSARLRSGSAELAGRLHDGAQQVPDWDDQQRRKVSQTIGAPVGLSSHSLTHADTFGMGFAPFFLSLALFIGGMIVWMLMRPIQARAVAGRLGAIRVVLASYWPALWIAVAQAAVMYLVARYGLDLTPVHPAAMFGFLVLIGAAYLALIQTFNAIFGASVARVVTLAFLMLQLVSSGGVYPVETTTEPFRILHPFDPMTYTVNGLRQLTVGGIDQRLWIAIAVLGGLLVASLLVSALAVRRDRRWTVERLHPPISV